MKSLPIPAASFLRLCLLLSICAVPLLFASCASEGVQKRVDRRTDAGGKLDENMRIRRDARDERYERQWDRLMN